MGGERGLVRGATVGIISLVCVVDMLMRYRFGCQLLVEIYTLPSDQNLIT